MASALITKGLRRLSPQIALRRHQSGHVVGAFSNAVMTDYDLEQTNYSLLDNGVKVATDTRKSGTSTVGIWMDVGTRLEGDDNNGVSNFLTHVAYKGTGKRSGADLEKEAEKRGVRFNASTSREMTSFTARCRNEDLPFAIEVLGEVAKNTSFDDNAVEEARKEILREVEEMQSNYSAILQDYLHATAYQGTPMSRTVIGPLENVENMKVAFLNSFANRLYRAPRMVLSCSGGVDHNNVTALADKYLGDISAIYEEDIPQITPCRYTGSEIRDRDDAMPLAHVAIAMEGPPGTSIDTVPLMVAAQLHGPWSRFCGGDFNYPSKLSATFSNDGSIHAYEHFFNIYSDTSLWGIQMVSERMELDRCVEFVMQEWMRMCTSASNFEVQRAKNALKTKIMMRLDGSTEAMCEDMGRHMLMYGHHMTAGQLIARINNVDAKKLRDACLAYIYDRCPAVASIGPVEAMPDYNRLRGNTWWYRF